MPLLFALPFGLLLGMSLAWLARAELARAELPLVLTRPFLVAVGLGAIVFGPIVAYFLLAHGDWSYLYLVRFGRVPSAVDLVLVIVAAAQIPLGFALAAGWATAKRGGPLVRVAATLGLVLILAGAIAGRRLATSATYAQYHGSFGVEPLRKTPLGRGVLWSWIALAAAYGWSARVLRTSEAER